jgi:hypothetical protein
MKTYRCPTRGKSLTKSEYEKALRVDEARKQHHAYKEAALARKEREQRARQLAWKRAQRDRMRQLKQEAKAKLQGEKGKVREQERARAARQQAGLREQLQEANERLRQRERGTTPQSEGLEFEEKLAARLRKEFPEDEIVGKGKSGDVLHTVIFNRKPAGVIIYECMRTASIRGHYVIQTHRANQLRKADFAVPVTTGKEKGFSGFAQMDGVSIVPPLAVVPLAAQLRELLIELARLKSSKEKRAVVVNS